MGFLQSTLSSKGPKLRDLLSRSSRWPEAEGFGGFGGGFEGFGGFGGFEGFGGFGGFRGFGILRLRVSGIGFGALGF